MVMNISKRETTPDSAAGAYARYRTPENRMYGGAARLRAPVQRRSRTVMANAVSRAPSQRANAQLREIVLSSMPYVGMRGTAPCAHFVSYSSEAPRKERGDKWCGLTGKQGERIVIEMEVQQVKIVSPLANSLEHGHVQCVWVADRAVQT